MYRSTGVVLTSKCNVPQCYPSVRAAPSGRRFPHQHLARDSSSTPLLLWPTLETRPACPSTLHFSSHSTPKIPPVLSPGSSPTTRTPAAHRQHRQYRAGAETERSTIGRMWWTMLAREENTVEANAGVSSETTKKSRVFLSGDVRGVDCAKAHISKTAIRN